MTWWKQIRELKNELTIAHQNCANLEKLLTETQINYKNLQEEYVKLESRHKEILKRQPNIEQLLLAFRDLETGSAVIKISRVDADSLFQWNPNR